LFERRLLTLLKKKSNNIFSAVRIPGVTHSKFFVSHSYGWHHLVILARNWVEKGERPPKHFVNLEKRNSSRRVISQGELEEGEIITNGNQISLEVEKYFTNLYSSETDVSKEQFSFYLEQSEKRYLFNLKHVKRKL